ncbi:hypothetical protein NQT69_10010 [Pseudoalteromonas shioyasakiensis]|uniref:hypothetical protein n=1 Tax=Pseudoalteromonas shioyasakiensis TaxID=1190813 RepID=UPI0021185CE2|nr:hypothetical protein [Pseudoalteromonas shioyasakiensis]MCQ8878332.1 hypothetical protein [Pseudoalteromonas shioyasakiensis]
MKKTLPFLLTTLCYFVSTQAYAESWDFKIEPYLMFTSIDGDTSIGTVDTPLAVDFDTILNNLDSGFMLRGEAFNQSNWGLLFDWAYMDLSKSKSQPVLGVLDARVRQGVLEVAVAHKQSSPSVGNWVNYIGLRRWDNTYQFTLEPNRLPSSSIIDRDEDWIDIILGYKIDRQFAENWLFTSSGDIGGFGLAAKLTGSLKLGVSYKFSEHWDVSALYKGTYVDYSTGDKADKSHFEYKTITHGPIISASYQF